MATTSLPTKSAIAIAAALMLTGCGYSGSGPVPIGPDTYMVANTGGWGSGGMMKADLYREAATFCQAQNRQLMASSSDSTDAGAYRYANAELVFRCLGANDPGLHRPTMKPTPNVRIEVER